MNAPRLPWTFVMIMAGATAATLAPACKPARAPVAVTIAPLRYHKVVVRTYTVDSTVTDPGTAPRDCEIATIDALDRMKKFASVVMSPDPPSADADTLVVEVAVKSLRIVSTGMRVAVRVLAGTSHMSLAVTAKDSSGAVVGQKVVNSDDGALSAVKGALSAGATDQSLPGDMGALVANAILEFAQEQPVTASPTAMQGAAPSSESCYPPCRNGYVCSPQEQCVSACNPPCRAGEHCTGVGLCAVDGY